MFVTSFIIALVAVFVTVDICQPYRDQLKDITPPIVAVTMDFIADKIRSLSGSISEITTASSIVPKVLFTKEEIKAYDGSEGSKGLYLGILGRVFDVSKGAQHYGPGGGYSFFTGKSFRPRFMCESVYLAVPGLTELALNWANFNDIIQLLSAPQSSATIHDGKSGQIAFITEKPGMAK